MDPRVLVSSGDGTLMIALLMLAFLAIVIFLGLR